MLRSNKPTNRSSIKWFIIIGLIIASQPINGNAIKLIPLTAPKVYRVLKETNNMDALPEGRIVMQGLAAAAGFATGLQTSLAGIFLYEVITADISEPTPAPPKYASQELCFSSRAARSLEDAEAIAEAYSRLDERDADFPPQVRKSEQKRTYRPVRNNKRHLMKRKRNSARRRRPHEILDLDDETASRQIVGEAVVLPATVAGTKATADTSTGTETNKVITAADDEVTCVLVQKLQK